VLQKKHINDAGSLITKALEDSVLATGVFCAEPQKL
jgi:hypothetical protein